MIGADTVSIPVSVMAIPAVEVTGLTIDSGALSTSVIAPPFNPLRIPIAFAVFDSVIASPAVPVSVPVMI